MVIIGLRLQFGGELPYCVWEDVLSGIYVTIDRPCCCNHGMYERPGFHLRLSSVDKCG